MRTRRRFSAEFKAKMAVYPRASRLVAQLPTKYLSCT